ncbi:MAG: GIY-YIG nuclease family protein [Fusobacteriaceae bacterium]
MKEYIYEILFPNKKVYIGKTNDLARRWEQHKKEANKGNQLKVYKAMRHFGIVNCIFQKIDEAPKDVIFEVEKDYIKESNSCEDGYNTQGDMETNILVRLDKELKEKSKKLALKKGVTLSELVRKFLEKEVKKNKI